MVNNIDIDRLRSLHINMPSWSHGVRVDDFLVAIGKKQTNSVYHIAEVTRVVPNKLKRTTRYYVKVYKSDLLTAIRRDSSQGLITIKWNTRKKK